MKTDVYSWRISGELKADLEKQARIESKSVAEILREMAADGLRARRNGHEDDAAERAALLKRVMRTVGTIRSGDPNLASKVSETVRARITRKHAEESDASRRNH